jgi:hypothetical protein
LGLNSIWVRTPVWVNGCVRSELVATKTWQGGWATRLTALGLCWAMCRQKFGGKDLAG